jgi:Condensation domain
MSKDIIEDIYPLSPAQRGILFHTLYAPRSGVYVTQFGCTLESGLDLSVLKLSWQRVVDRHPLLRTAFAWKRREEPLQIVFKRIDLPWADHDWRGLSATEQRASLQEYLESDRAAGFEMSKAPLARIAIFRLSEDVYHLVWTTHHILLDGWSIQLLLKEVFAFYDALSRGEDLSLEPARPYRDYILWLKQQDLSRAETFWREMLQGVSAPTPLTVDHPAQTDTDAKVEHDVQQLMLSSQATASLEALARQSMLTLNTLVEAAWLLLLSRYSGQRDVVCGINVSGRPPELAGAESMVGLFVNTLPVRARVIPEEPLLEWLKRLQQLHVEISQYEYSPLADVQAWSDLPRGTDIFESIFVFENYPLETTRGRGGNFRVGEFYSKYQSSYPLTIVAVPGHNLTLIAEYDNKRFDAASIKRMLGHLEVLLA